MAGRAGLITDHSPLQDQMAARERAMEREVVQTGSRMVVDSGGGLAMKYCSDPISRLTGRLLGGRVCVARFLGRFGMAMGVGGRDQAWRVCNPRVLGRLINRSNMRRYRLVTRSVDIQLSG